jgi:quercetin dioxygenase-like cupin family protein
MSIFPARICPKEVPGKADRPDPVLPQDHNKLEAALRPIDLCMKGSLLLALALVSGPALRAEKDAEGFVRLAPGDMPWKDMPGGLGAQMAVVAGDPSTPGLYIVRVKFPPGVMSRPHFHPEDRHAVVLKGTWWTGTGDVFDPSRTVPLKPGSYMKHPAGGHHFDGAKDEEVIVQIAGYGPTAMTLLAPGEGAFGRSTPH